MNEKLGSLFEKSKGSNSLNLLRYFAAVLVIYSHSFPLKGLSSDDEIFLKYLGFDGGRIAVALFFILSGFLTSYSIERRPSIKVFLWNRAMRIYPGLWFQFILVTLFCLLLLPLNWSSLDTLGLLKYLFRNTSLLFGLEYQAGNFFQGFNALSVVNGSLWTLPWELYAYISMAFFHLILAKFKIPFTLIGFGFFSCVYWMGLVGNQDAIEFVLFYWIGAIIAQFRAIIPLTFFYLILALCPVFYLVNIKILLLLGILLPLIFLGGLLMSKGPLLKFNNWGDPSYGVYIYAFPIQQMLLFYLPNISVMALFLTATLLSTICGYLSWHFVENKMLKIYKK